jgi:hypothetical protein
MLMLGFRSCKFNISTYVDGWVRVCTVRRPFILFVPALFVVTRLVTVGRFFILSLSQILATDNQNHCHSLYYTVTLLPTVLTH